MNQRTLCDHVRNMIRCAYRGTGEEFRLSQVYAIADADADQYPSHLNRKVRHAVMRQMLQDERGPKGLTFIRPGLYKYPKSLDFIKESGYPGGMTQLETRIISRSDAMSLGLARYFTGRPCKREHISERKTGNRNCVSCAGAADAQRRSGAAVGDAPVSLRPDLRGVMVVIKNLTRDHKRLAKEYDRLAVWAMRRGYNYSKRRREFLAERDSE